MRAVTIALILGLAGIVWLNSFSGVDLALADYYYDPHLHSFPMKESWFPSVFMHEWMKYGLTAIALCLITICFIDRATPYPQLSALFRTRLHIIALSSILVPVAISLIKSQSSLHCPWDIVRYGGTTPYLRLIDALPSGLKAGHCFPAGHASSGLWLAAIAVCWLPHSPRKAALAYVCGLSIGMALGWVQQMRGAHFLSHTLMSAWVASCVISLIAWRLLASSQKP